MAPRKLRTRRTMRRNVRRRYTKRRVGGKPKFFSKPRTRPPLEETIVIPTDPMPTDPMSTRGRQSRSPSPTNQITEEY